ncbi:hypothetical protein [Deinococcus actinosclerus]|nr:hypothetical protein [Deinococcus actinosclerus]
MTEIDVSQLALRNMTTGQERQTTLTIQEKADGLISLSLQVDSAGVLTAHEATGWDALTALRLALEAQGWLLICYGTSLNVTVTPMALNMGIGSVGSRLRMGVRGGLDTVDIFQTGPDVQPATVQDQLDWYQAWLRSLAANSSA